MASRKEHSDEEWEKHRDIIKHLYIDEDKSLSEIMADMERSYGFCATSVPLLHHI